MSSSTLTSLLTRFLQEAQPDEQEYEITNTFGGDDDEEEEDDEYIFPPWAFFLLVIFVALLMVGVIFYCSYKHEVCRGIKKKQEVHDEASIDIEEGKKIATKTFMDSQRLERLPQHIVEQYDSARKLDASATTNRNSNTSNPSASLKTSVMHSSVAAPRCVLCSKAFEIGENVTHTTACHHEYHESCLKKYWTKQKANHGKCPVCRVEYAVDHVSPSVQFSEEPSQHHVSYSSLGASLGNLGPFDEREEDQS